MQQPGWLTADWHLKAEEGTVWCTKEMWHWVALTLCLSAVCGLYVLCCIRSKRWNCLLLTKVHFKRFSIPSNCNMYRGWVSHTVIYIHCIQHSISLTPFTVHKNTFTLNSYFACFYIRMNWVTWKASYCTSIKFQTCEWHIKESWALLIFNQPDLKEIHEMASTSQQYYIMSTCNVIHYVVMAQLGLGKQQSPGWKMKATRKCQKLRILEWPLGADFPTEPHVKMPNITAVIYMFTGWYKCGFGLCS